MVSAYQAARLQDRYSLNWMLVLNRYLEAYELRPTRVEPLAQVVKHYRQTAQYRLGYLFGSQAMAIPMPEDLLFIRETNLRI